MKTIAGERCTCTHCSAHDAGLRGPFTPSEFATLFPLANAPEPKPATPELVEAMASVDAARIAYEQATKLWADAVSERTSEQLKALRRPGEYVDTTLAEEREAAATEVRDEVGEALHRALVRYNALAQAVSLRRIHQERERETAERATEVASSKQARRRFLFGRGRQERTAP